jgi:hypothetical protein
MMNQDEARRRQSGRLKVPIGLCLLFSLFFASAAILVGCSVKDVFHTGSEVMIWNRTGFDVQFEQVTIDDQVVWTGPELIVSPKDLSKPWLDNRRHCMLLEFRAPKKLVEFKLVMLNKMQEKEALSCTLDNRSRPCFFEVFYHKGKLVCFDCEKTFVH